MRHLKGCAVGCGVLAAALVIVGVGATFRVLGPLGRAVSTRSVLEERFGGPETYTPPASGVASSERIEAFLQVRRAIMPSCSNFTEISDRMRRLEEMDERDDVSKMEAVLEATAMSRSMLGLGATMGDLYETRNDALLEVGMGLGEYTYLYLTAYQRQLANPIDEEIFMEGSPQTRRVRSAVRGMLSRQLEALRSDADSDPAMLAALETEVAALGSDPRRLPWQGGLPPEQASSFAPYRLELDSLFCPAMTQMELMRNTRRGLAVESD